MKTCKSVARKIRIGILIAILAIGVGLVSNASADWVDGKHKMLDRYAEEHSKCFTPEHSKPDNTKCPPYVIYYKDPSQFQLNAQDDLLVDINGNKHTTEGADKSWRFKEGAALFVVDGNSQLFASKADKKYLFHHSSIANGKPVNAAGEMVVKDRIVIKFNNCSGHDGIEAEKSHKT